MTAQEAPSSRRLLPQPHCPRGSLAKCVYVGEWALLGPPLSVSAMARPAVAHYS